MKRSGTGRAALRLRSLVSTGSNNQLGYRSLPRERLADSEAKCYYLDVGFGVHTRVTETNYEQSRRNG